MLAAILSQSRFALYGLLAAGLLIGGWTANGWRMKAAKADHLQAVLSATLKREVEANAARVALARQLEGVEAATTAGIKTIIKKVKVYVPADARCNLPDEFRRVLDAARAGNLPATTDGPVTSPAVP